jgi:hypothetical protein
VRQFANALRLSGFKIDCLQMYPARPLLGRTDEVIE